MGKIEKLQQKYVDVEQNFSSSKENDRRIFTNIQQNKSTSSFFKKNFKFESEWQELTPGLGPLNFTWSFAFNNFPLEFIQFFSHQILLDETLEEINGGDILSKLSVQFVPGENVKFGTVLLKIHFIYAVYSTTYSIKVKSILNFQNTQNFI